MNGATRPSRDRIARELAAARAARALGNEGRARVCARRAAGWAIQAYLAAQGIARGTTSAYDHIRYLHDAADTHAEMRAVLSHFLQKVEVDAPGSAAYFPLDADLIAEAEWLAAQLLP